MLRSLLMDIYPPSLRAAGLRHALQDLAATARTRGVDVDLSFDDDFPTISEAHEQLIYRIAQETLRNAVTHAAPCTVVMRLRRDGEDIILEVGDDGPGFSSDAITDDRADGHLGTQVLLDLTARAGAELSLRTAPGTGTDWRLRIPAAATSKKDTR